jgi:hypothetical protein
MMQDINPVATHRHSEIHSNRRHPSWCSRARVQLPAQPRPHEIASRSRSRRCCREASRAGCCAFIAYSDNTFICTYMKRKKIVLACIVSAPGIEDLTLPLHVIEFRRCYREASRAGCCAFIAYSDNTFTCTYMKREKIVLACIVSAPWIEDLALPLHAIKFAARPSLLTARPCTRCRMVTHSATPHWLAFVTSPHARRPSPVDYSFSI